MVKLHVNGQEQSFDGDPSMDCSWPLTCNLTMAVPPV